MLDKEGYKGNVFDKHVGLNIHEPEFEKWIFYFNKTVNDFFEGEKATFRQNNVPELLKYTFCEPNLTKLTRGFRLNYLRLFYYLRIRFFLRVENFQKRNKFK